MPWLLDDLLSIIGRPTRGTMVVCVWVCQEWIITKYHQTPLVGTKTMNLFLDVFWMFLVLFHSLVYSLVPGSRPCIPGNKVHFLDIRLEYRSSPAARLGGDHASYPEGAWAMGLKTLKRYDLRRCGKQHTTRHEITEQTGSATIHQNHPKRVWLTAKVTDWLAHWLTNPIRNRLRTF